MSTLSNLPDVVLQLIVARLELIDAIALACTCDRFFSLATGISPQSFLLQVQHRQRADGQFNQHAESLSCRPQLPVLAAAAKQRLVTVAEGGWRDRLLLTAWRQQQIMAEVAAARARKGAAQRQAAGISGAGSSSSAAFEHITPKLPQQQQQQQHGVLAGNTSADVANKRQQQPILVDFSGFFVPAPAVLISASCFITDGSASAMLGLAGNSSSSTTTTTSSSTSSAPSSSSVPGGSSSSIIVPGGSSSSRSRSAKLHPSEPEQQQEQQEQQQQRRNTWQLPMCDQPQLSHTLTLVRGHLPPQDRNASWGPIARPPTVNSILNPSANPTALNRQCTPNPVADVTAAAAGRHGLQQLQHYLDHLQQRERQQQQDRWMELLRDNHQQQQQQQTEQASGSPAAAAAAGEQQVHHTKPLSAPSSSRTTEQQQPPVQVIVLPVPPPPGSTAALSHPWPLLLNPGCNSQGLNAAGQGLESGYLQYQGGLFTMLKPAMTQQGSALVLRGGPGSSFVTGSMMAETSKGFLSSLHVLDLAGQHGLSDAEISVLLSRTPRLTTLGLANTCAAGSTFMMLNPSAPSSSMPQHRSQMGMQNPGTASSRGLAACALGLGSGGPGPKPRCTRQGLAPCGAAQTLGQIGDHQLAPGRSGFKLLSHLAVLDVSGCSALSQQEGNVFEFKLFQNALSRLDHLKALIARRVNVDACLLESSSSSSVCKAQAAAAAAAAAGTHTSGACNNIGSADHHTTAVATVGAATSSSSAAAAAPPPPVAAAAVASAVSGGVQLTLSHLEELDVSDAVQLSADCMVAVLSAARKLKRLGVTGCTTLAAAAGTDRLQAALQQFAATHHAAAATTEDVRNVTRQQQLQEGMKQQGQQQQHQGCTQAPSDPTPCTAAITAAAAAVAGESSSPLPSLTHLAVGWGWSAKSIALLAGTSPCITHFTAAVGACVTDSLLQLLADSCPHLQHLALSLCTVSSAGVGAVLSRCPKLVCLQLQQCVGPFDTACIGQQLAVPQQQQAQQQQQQHDELQTQMPKQQDLESQQNQQNHQRLLQQQQQQDHGSQQQQQGYRWQLSTLQLDGAPVHASNEQLLQLLAITEKVKLGQTWSKLVNLCLVRVNGLNDSLLQALTAARCSLRHLKLQDCYAATLDRSSTSSTASAPAAAAFSEAALLQLLRPCCTSSLVSLQLRHAVAPLSSGFVSAAVAAAPLLQMLVLDACDLPESGAFELEPSPHGALEAVHVMRCRDLGQACIAAATAAASDTDTEHHHHQKQEQQQQQQGGDHARKSDKQLVVHLLHLARSLHLPAA